MKIKYSMSDSSKFKDYYLENYYCPFCQNSAGAPGELTIAFEKSSLELAWTECSKGYVNCCSIAEIVARLSSSPDKKTKTT